MSSFDPSPDDTADAEGSSGPGSTPDDATRADGADVAALVERLDSDGERDRLEAASDLATLADEKPGRVGNVAGDLVDGLADEEAPVRVELSRAVFGVAEGAPSRLLDYGEVLVDLVTDPRPEVRTNVVRSLAALAVRDPGLVVERFPLVSVLLDDDCDRVRRAAARTLEAAVRRRTGQAVAEVPWIADLAAAFPDGDDDVDAALCLALAHCRRAGTDLGVEAATVAGLFEREDQATRIAATAMLGATGSPAVRRHLRTAATADPSGAVRRAAKCALREAVVPDRDPDRSPDRIDLATTAADRVLARGDWIAVTPPSGGPVPPGDRYVGEVVLVGRDDLDCGTGDLSTVLRCYNPYEGYCVDLGRREEVTYAAVQDPTPTAGPQFPVRDVRRVDRGRDLAALLYATPGDELSFTVEDVPHEAVVEAVDPEDGTVRAKNDRDGTAVEFRPTGRWPYRVEFERGRGFETGAIRLTDADTVAYDALDVDEDPWIHPRRHRE